MASLEFWGSISSIIAGLPGGRWPLALLPPLLVLAELLYLLLAATAVLAGRASGSFPPVSAPIQGGASRQWAASGGIRQGTTRRRGGVSAAAVLPALAARPCVSCIVTCYGEGRLVARTLRSLLDQSWLGPLEVLAVVDGALQNEATLASAQSVRVGPKSPFRRVLILPKWIRGGRASALNAGLAVSQGQLVLALDGDTSFDRDMVARMVERFREPGVVAVAGTLRVRNADINRLTRLQALDYSLFRQLVRAGLGQLNIVNNIPGAHGAFRREALLCAGGWDNGSAEDVDLSLRLRKCLGQYPGWRLRAAADVIGHTDVPDKWGQFFLQRLRWEGDPAFLYLRKHTQSLRPATMGWSNWLFAMCYGLGFQGLLPLGYLLAIPALLFLPWQVAALSVVLAWGLHMAGCLLGLTVQVLIASDRSSEDARRLWLLPLYSWFIFLLRAWSGLSILHSLMARSERDSSMAPWWVLRKSRF